MGLPLVAEGGGWRHIFWLITFDNITSIFLAHASFFHQIDDIFL